MHTKLKSVSISGFKSIRKLADLEFRNTTILLGANGAGKSNFVSFFHFLSHLLTPDGLQIFVGKEGGASKLLFDGPEITKQIEAELTIETESGANDYSFWLAHAAGDSLVFTSEQFRFSRTELGGKARWQQLGAGHNKAELPSFANEDTTANVVLNLLRQLVVFQFHNTSQTAWIRQKSRISDGKYLKADGGNLSAFLYNIRERNGHAYARIEEFARMALPFFAEFVLDDDYDHVLLQWRERNSDTVFDASQASDGMLRYLLLVSLLLQPEDRVPAIIFIDEPELGLHPYAISVLADLIRSASEKSQIVLSTQSGALVDHFEPEDIVVVDRRERESSFTRLSSKEYADLHKDSKISELWERNVFGGGPLQ